MIAWDGVEHRGLYYQCRMTVIHQAAVSAIEGARLRGSLDEICRAIGETAQAEIHARALYFAALGEDDPRLEGNDHGENVK